MKNKKETFRIFLGTYLKEFHSFENYENLKQLWPVRVRWVAQENLHFTWKFLGDITSSRIKRLSKDLCTCVQFFKPMQLKFDTVEVWPRPSAPRQLVWRGTDMNNNIAENFKLFDKTLTKTGFSREKRSFKPHITLGRFKMKSKPEVPVVIPENFDLKPVTIEVNEISIIKSDLLSSGPKYTVIENILIP